MSFASVIPYIRAKMITLGYQEHEDTFDEYNIPSTILAKSFSIEPGTFSASLASHTVFEWTVPMSVKIFLNGYRRPVQAIEDAIAKMSIISDSLFEIEDRYKEEGIASVSPSNISFKKLTDGSDHIIVATLDLEARVYIYNSKNCL